MPAEETWEPTKAVAASCEWPGKEAVLRSRKGVRTARSCLFRCCTGWQHCCGTAQGLQRYCSKGFPAEWCKAGSDVWSHQKCFLQQKQAETRAPNDVSLGRKELPCNPRARQINKATLLENYLWVSNGKLQQLQDQTFYRYCAIGEVNPSKPLGACGLSQKTRKNGRNDKHC